MYIYIIVFSGFLQILSFFFFFVFALQRQKNRTKNLYKIFFYKLSTFSKIRQSFDKIKNPKIGFFMR